MNDTNITSRPSDTLNEVVGRSQTNRYSYYIVRNTFCDGIVALYPYAQPINQKTGQPWQASRSLPTTGHILSNGGKRSGYRPGPIPENWCESREWNAADACCGTLEEALAAIETHKAKAAR